VPAEPVNQLRTRILVLRHGQSEWNAAGRWQGQADPPLTTLGLEQARLAGGLIATECPTFDVVVTSDLERARVTGQTIASVIGCSAHRLDPRWRENDAGEWQGLTQAEIRTQWPGYLEIVAQNAGGCVLVISHGGVLRLMHEHLGGGEQRFPNLAGSWFEHTPTDGWKCGSLLFPLQLIADELRNTGAVE
jgi:broad specificity phosphatase PhoE